MSNDLNTKGKKNSKLENKSWFGWFDYYYLKFDLESTQPQDINDVNSVQSTNINVTHVWTELIQVDFILFYFIFTLN